MPKAKAKAGEPLIYNGRHLKACECPTCLPPKLSAFEARVKAMSKMPMPTDIDHCIPVRSHWRRSKTYLSRHPMLREAVLDIVDRLIDHHNKR